MLDSFEVNLARRVLKQNGLSPAVDVILLLQKYANLEITAIPFNIDAVCLDLKRPGIRATVIVNESRPYKRRRFTLAHELGHVLIPWHRGSIIDDLPDVSGYSADQLQIETEANKFASELLMPRDWLHAMASQMTNPPQFVRDVSDAADVSVAAAVFSTLMSLPRGYIFAEVSHDNVVRRSGRSNNTLVDVLRAGDRIDPNIEFEIAEDRWSLQTPNCTYWWWKLPGKLDIQQDLVTDWRPVLSNILNSYSVNEIVRKKAYASVSATAASANARSGISAEEIYALILQRFFSKAKSDPLFAFIMRHPKIKQYAASRASTFSNK